MAAWLDTVDDVDLAIISALTVRGVRKGIVLRALNARCIQPLCGHN